MNLHTLKLFLIFAGVHTICDLTWFMVGRYTDMPVWGSVLSITLVSGIITYVAEIQEHWK